MRTRIFTFYKVGKLFLAGGIVLSAATGFAASPARVLADFDLVGTWSNDCSLNITKELTASEKERIPPFAVMRLTIVAPWWGVPTGVWTQTFQPSTTDKTIVDIWEYAWEISSATRVSEDKIKLSYFWTKAKDFEWKNEKPDFPPVTGMVFEKVGNKILRDKMLLEKCLD